MTPGRNIRGQITNGACEAVHEVGAKDNDGHPSPMAAHGRSLPRASVYIGETISVGRCQSTKARQSGDIRQALLPGIHFTNRPFAALQRTGLTGPAVHLMNWPLAFRHGADRAGVESSATDVTASIILRIIVVFPRPIRHT